MFKIKQCKWSANNIPYVNESTSTKQLLFTRTSETCLLYPLSSSHFLGNQYPNTTYNQRTIMGICKEGCSPSSPSFFQGLKTRTFQTPPKQGSVYYQPKHCTIMGKSRKTTIDFMMQKWPKKATLWLRLTQQFLSRDLNQGQGFSRRLKMSYGHMGQSKSRHTKQRQWTGGTKSRKFTSNQLPMMHLFWERWGCAARNRIQNEGCLWVEWGGIGWG